MDPVAFAKYTLLIASSPIWMPMARAMLEEFLWAMKPDGGIWGPIPTDAQRAEIVRKMRREAPGQVHEPKATYRRAAAMAIEREAAKEEARKKKEGKRRKSGGRAGLRAGPQAGNSGRAFDRR